MKKGPDLTAEPFLFSFICKPALEQTSAFYALNVCCAKSFGRAFDLELHFFAVAKTFIPSQTLDVVAVDENVLATVAGLDETESLFCAEPLYSSVLHNLCVLFVLRTCFTNQKST